MQEMVLLDSVWFSFGFLDCSNFCNVGNLRSLGPVNFCSENSILLCTHEREEVNSCKLGIE